MPVYKTTITGLIKFLDRIRKPSFKNTVFQKISKIIWDTLRSDIFTGDYSKVYEIWDATEMRRLIKTSGMPKKASYNPKYLAWKQLMGLPPHVLTGTMQRNVFVDIHKDRVLFYIPSGALTTGARMRSPWGGKRGRGRLIQSATPTTRTRIGSGGKKVYYFNFGPIHESRKSILKSTMVFGWQNIMDAVRAEYLNEIRLI